MCLGEGSGEGVDVTLVSNKIRYISLVDLSRVGFMFVVVYYESLKRELKTKTIYEYRCDERLKRCARHVTN